MPEYQMNHLFFALTQEGGAPPVPGESPVTASGSIPADASGVSPVVQTPPASPFGNQFFLIIMLMIVGMFIFSMMGTRRDKKKRESMLSAIKKHDKVQTIGGVIGSVVEVKPDTVVLKVDESSNTRITFSRSAIQQVLTVSAETGAARNGGTE